MECVLGKAPNSARRTAVVAQASQMDCQLLASVIEKQCRIEVLACVFNSAEVERAVQERNPHLLLMSTRLQDGTYAGLKVARNLKAKDATAKVVMLLDWDDRELVVESFRCGAKGVLTRNESSKELCKCIPAVLEDQIWASDLHIKYVIEALAQMHSPVLVGSKSLASLTKREYAVVSLLAAGLSNREISGRLKLTENTIKNYVSGILHKLGASTRVELVLHFFSEQSHDARGPEQEDSTPKFGT